MKSLTERVYSSIGTAEREIVRDVTKKLCYIGLDCDTELKSTVEINIEKTHVLPDGNIITVAPNISVSRKCCSSQSSLVKEPAGSTAFLSR